MEFVPASHEDPNNPGVYKKVLFTLNDVAAGGRLQMLNWAKLPKGKSFQRHYHEDMEEIFVIIKGCVEMELAGENCQLMPGDAVMVPANALHCMTNTAAEDAEYIVVGLSQGKKGKTVIVA